MIANGKDVLMATLSRAASAARRVLRARRTRARACLGRDAGGALLEERCLVLPSLRSFDPRVQPQVGRDLRMIRTVRSQIRIRGALDRLLRLVEPILAKADRGESVRSFRNI